MRMILFEPTDWFGVFSGEGFTNEIGFVPWGSFLSFSFEFSSFRVLDIGLVFFAEPESKAIYASFSCLGPYVMIL